MFVIGMCLDYDIVSAYRGVVSGGSLLLPSKSSCTKRAVLVPNF